jgi:hypothetical protein
MLQIVHRNALLKTVSPSRSKTSCKDASPGCLAAIILINKYLYECYKFWLGMLHIVHRNALLKTVSPLRSKTSHKDTSPGCPAAIILSNKCMHECYQLCLGTQ